MRYDALIFDLDGTLADTADDIAESMAKVLTRHDLPPASREDVVRSVGSGVSKLVERLVPVPEKRLAVVASFMVEYDGRLLNRTRLYPEVAETLESLKGVAMGVLTNKPERMTRRILEGLGIAGYFRAVVGGDTLPVRKPDPAVVWRVFSELKTERPLIVGDSGVDLATARSAQMPCCAVTYGYHQPGELDGADYRIDRFGQVLEIVRGGDQAR